MTLAGSFAPTPARAADINLLNVSYDPTRELYSDFNKAFIAAWKKDHPADTVTIRQSHGGSGAQARTVIDGSPADVVTLALAYDIDAIAAKGLLATDWQKRLPDNSSPYTSTIVLLVRKVIPRASRLGRSGEAGHQGHHPQSQDLGRRALELPRRLRLCAQAEQCDEQKAQAFVQALFKNVPVLDTGARGATITFVERGLGDVLIAWENEAYLSVNELGPDKFDIVTPPYTILAEPPVAVVDKNVDKKGTRDIAEALSEVSLYARGPGDRRPQLLPPAPRQRGREVQGQIRQDGNLHHRRRVRRLAKAQQKFFADGGVF